MAIMGTITESRLLESMSVILGESQRTRPGMKARITPASIILEITLFDTEDGLAA